MEYARLGPQADTAPLFRRALEERCVLRADLVLASTPDGGSASPCPLIHTEQKE